MSYGLQIFDGAGRPILELTDRLPRVWSTHTVSGGNFTTGPSGFVSVPGMVRDGTWLAIPGMVQPATGGDYVLGGMNCVCVSGGFNWYIYDSSAFVCTVAVYKL